MRDDAMWAEFQPLWRDLGENHGGVLIAGGYGLFLKQVWLSENLAASIVVPFERWSDGTPRVTNDFDLVLDLELISQAEANRKFAAALRQNGYAPTDRNPRWQFEKSVRPGRKVIVDLHASPPAKGRPNLSVDRIRIKHKPSLGENGIHARQNPEAFGADLHPFSFRIDQLRIAVPNPVTWSIMKLTAMRDQWVRSEEEYRRPSDRAFLREQAIKHSRDVCRVVAMVTPDERDHAAEVSEKIASQRSFVDARAIAAEFFAADDGRGLQFASSIWQEDDLLTIRTMLGEWFG